MTIEEKLSNIYDFSMEDARREGQAELDAFQAELDKAFSEHREIREREARDAIRDEKLEIQKSLNKEYAAKQSDLRQAAAGKQEEVLDRLFLRVRERLLAAKETPEYEAFLLKKAAEIREFAGKDEIELYVDRSDSALIPSLEGKSGAVVRISEEAFDGGIQGVIPSRHILIDYSFEALIEEEKTRYRSEVHE